MDSIWIIINSSYRIMHVSMWVCGFPRKRKVYLFIYFFRKTERWGTWGTSFHLYGKLASGLIDL